MTDKQPEALRLADILESWKGAVSNEAASMLRKLGRVYAVAYEMVHAKTHEHSRDAYAEMIDLIKGKQSD